MKTNTFDEWWINIISQIPDEDWDNNRVNYYDLAKKAWDAAMEQAEGK